MSSSIPFQEELTDVFFHQLSQKTSGLIFGSGATGNWVAGRSDLDLLLLIPEVGLELLEKKLQLWEATPGLPYLDGYALYLSQNVLMARRLDEYRVGAWPVTEQINAADLWNIRNRSLCIFGDNIALAFPDIGLSDLSSWARRELERLIGVTPGEVPTANVSLSGLIWSVSWSARMLMLSKGVVCDSKRSALIWLADTHPDVAASIGCILNDYMNSDAEPMSISPAQAAALLTYCRRLMQQELSLISVAPHSMTPLPRQRHD